MGEKIVLTASAGTFSGLAAALSKVPVTVEEHPLIRFEPPVDWSPLDAALTKPNRFESIAFTSPRAAQAVVERLRVGGLRWVGDLHPSVWAVGPATADALQSMLGPVRVPGSRAEPNASPAAALGQAMLEAGAMGPVLFPCGEQRRDDLPTILRAKGVPVHEVVCYRSVLASRSEAGAAAASGSVVVVASPSVLRLLVEACAPSKRPRLVAVGPTTALSARAAGWTPAAVANEPTIHGVASAITRLLATG
jgi:uroporphyrinogen III methyltransferase / synthase